MYILTYVRMDLRVLVTILSISRLILPLLQIFWYFVGFFNGKYGISAFKEKIMLKYLLTLYKRRASTDFYFFFKQTA